MFIQKHKETTFKNTINLSTPDMLKDWKKSWKLIKTGTQGCEFMKWSRALSQGSDYFLLSTKQPQNSIHLILERGQVGRTWTFLWEDMAWTLWENKPNFHTKKTESEFIWSRKRNANPTTHLNLYHLLFGDRNEYIS